MIDYDDYYKKYYAELLGLPVEEFDNVLASRKRPSAERIAQMNKLTKIAMGGGSTEEIASLTPEEQFEANQMRNKMYYRKKSLSKGMTEGVAATQDVINKLRQGKMTESLPESAFGNEVEDYLKKQSGEMAKAAEKNIVKAGSAGKVLRGLGKVAGPVGAALTAVDMGGALAELRKLGAEKIAQENAPKANGVVNKDNLFIPPDLRARIEADNLAAERILEKTSPKESEKAEDSINFKGPYTPEERLRVKEMLKKLRSEAKLR